MNLKWGSKKSITAGDYIYVVAIKLLALTGNHQVATFVKFVDFKKIQLIVRLANKIQDCPDVSLGLSSQGCPSR